VLFGGSLVFVFAVVVVGGGGGVGGVVDLLLLLCSSSSSSDSAFPLSLCSRVSLYAGRHDDDD
jgi:hypothetical protein